MYKRLFQWKDRKGAFMKGLFAAGLSLVVVLSGACIKNGVPVKTQFLWGEEAQRNE